MEIFVTSSNPYVTVISLNYLFHDGGPYHIEISPLISSANQWTGFYMIMTSVMKELKQKPKI